MTASTIKTLHELKQWSNSKLITCKYKWNKLKIKWVSYRLSNCHRFLFPVAFELCEILILKEQTFLNLFENISLTKKKKSHSNYRLNICIFTVLIYQHFWFPIFSLNVFIVLTSDVSTFTSLESRKVQIGLCQIHLWILKKMNL